MKYGMRKQMRLMDLVKIVSRYARNDHELGLAVADLINRGRIKIQGRYAHTRVVVT
jgi:hypothetical protein